MGVIDTNYQVIFATNQYSSGTSFNELIALDFDEDGRLWGVDIQGTTTETGSATPRYRLILLNNFTIPNQSGIYEVVLRNSYLFPIGYNKVEGTFLIKKAQGEARYFIVSNDYGTLYGTGRLISIEINVGSSNEWYQETLSSGGVQDIDDIYVEPYQDDYIVYYTNTLRDYINICYWVEGNGGDIVDTINEMATSLVLVSSTNLAFTSVSSDTYDFYYYNSGSLKLLDQVEQRGFVNDYIDCFYINGLYFYIVIKSNDLQRIETTIGLYDGEDYTKDVSTYADTLFGTRTVFVKNNYGLFTLNAIIVSSAGTELFSNKITYYQGLYNGLSYDYYNSLIPQNAELYDENDKIVFARQLYDYTTINNTTSAILEVPNAMLNNNIISTQNLYGKTALELINNTDDITKNIYEMLYINFINIIEVLDTDTNTKYMQTAININNNINSSNEDSTTMENKKIAKIRINYIDDTSRIQTVELNNLGGTTYRIEATFYTMNEIETIDIISEDETQTYITLDASNLQNGEYYTLLQSMKIE